MESKTLENSTRQEKVPLFVLESGSNGTWKFWRWSEWSLSTLPVVSSDHSSLCFVSSFSQLLDDYWTIVFWDTGLAIEYWNLFCLTQIYKKKQYWSLVRTLISIMTNAINDVITKKAPSFLRQGLTLNNHVRRFDFFAAWFFSEEKKTSEPTLSNVVNISNILHIINASNAPELAENQIDGHESYSNKLCKDCPVPVSQKNQWKLVESWTNKWR